MLQPTYGMNWVDPEESSGPSGNSTVLVDSRCPASPSLCYKLCQPSEAAHRPLQALVLLLEEHPKDVTHTVLLLLCLVFSKCGQTRDRGAYVAC